MFLSPAILASVTDDRLVTIARSRKYGCPSSASQSIRPFAKWMGDAIDEYESDLLCGS